MALSFGLTLAIRSRCASTTALELSRLERIASASSPAEAEVMLSPASLAAIAGLTSEPRPATAAAPTSAAVPKKSRRPILLSICFASYAGSRSRAANSVLAGHARDVGWAKALLRRAHHLRSERRTEWWARRRTLRVRRL